MTCPDFKAFLECAPQERLPSELVAFLRHHDACQDCRAWFDDFVAGAKARMSPERINRNLAISAALGERLKRAESYDAEL